MPTGLLATADDLIAWAPRREAQEMLPALVRRLVHATAPRATHVGFPAGNAIHAPGWDGVVVLNDDHHVIPRGLSVWEMGTNRDPRTKAQSDYAKRMSAPGTGPRGIVDPATSTFVFVTPRRWSGKSDWIAERKADAVWRDVRAYDADDLEEWLEQAPATHVWASHLVGVRPDDVDDVDAIWRDWSGSTEPALSTALMLAGRANAQQEVGKWLRSAGAPFLGVAAESIEASLAFVGATLEAMPPDDRVALLSRMIVVRSATAWHQLMGAHHPLVLLPTFPAGDLLVRAERHGHRVLMPLAMEDAREADLRVPRLRRDAARAALEAMGLTSERAGSLDGVARRSLLALRRALSRIPAVRRPPWSSGNEAVGLVAITLLGAGKVDDAADCAALAYIADESSAVAVARLRRWVVSADPPVRSVGDAFFLVSKAEAWETVRPHITAEHMRRFEAVARRIFGIAPALAPDAEIVGLDGKVSALMLRGTADTLALLVARGAGIMRADGETAAGVATRIVQAALVAEDWSAFAGQLPALAEAAPDALLEAVDASLAREEANAAQAVGKPLAPPRELASLLWALETVAWSSGHLTRVVRALGRLAALIGDTGAGNHPRGSLRTILLPWLPSTSASAEDRLHAIDQVLVVTPGVGWQLLLDLLPQSGSWVMRGSRPTWREWGQEQTTNVSAVAYEQQITAIVDRVLVNASGVPERWAAVIEKLDDVPVQSHQAIVAELTRLASVEDATPDFIAVRTAIWHALRMLVSRHRSFADADWALPTAYVAPLAALWPAFAPSEVVERSAWLFGNNVQLIEGKEGDYDEHRARVAAQRVSSASAWYEALGAGGLLDAAERVADAGALGEALATSDVIPNESEEHAFLTRAFDGMSADVPALPRHVLAQAFLRGRGNAVGAEHTLALLARSPEWNPVARAVALLTLLATATTWEHVAALPLEGQAYYWQHLFAFRVESHEAAVALDALARFERPHAALDLAAHLLAREARDAAEQRDATSLDAGQAEVADGMPRSMAEVLVHANDADTAGRGGISVQHVADLLERAATVERDVTGQRLDGYDLARLLATLRATGASEVSRERVVGIEWLWLPSLDYGSEPAALNQYLSQHPAFFAQLVASVYQSDAVSGGAAADEDTAHAVARFGPAPFPIDGGRAYRLLERARFRPSADIAANDGLLAWATEARSMLTEQGYARAGERALGRMLARGTSGTDAAWPDEPVRDLVEQFASKDFEVGIEIGRLNGRGVVTKHPLDGGEQERGLEAFYREAAERVAARWPRTAAMLCRLAETYARDANREDTDAAFRHDAEW